MSKKENPAVQSAEVPWSQSAVMICTKCARKMGCDDAADSLKGELKSRFKARDLGHAVRVVTSSCLNVCPDERIAVVVATQGAKATFKALTVTPDTEPEEIVRALRK